MVKTLCKGLRNTSACNLRDTHPRYPIHINLRY
jgi:hypothetical protein